MLFFYHIKKEAQYNDMKKQRRRLWLLSPMAQTKGRGERDATASWFECFVIAHGIGDDGKADDGGGRGAREGKSNRRGDAAAIGKHGR